MTKKLSRAPQINVEKCAQNAGGQFNLVLIASQKARELRASHRNKETAPPGVIDALIEIQEGRVDAKEYLTRVGQKKIKKG